MINAHEIDKLIGVSFILIASLVSVSQIPPVREAQADTIVLSTVIPSETASKLKRLEFRERQQNKKLDSLAVVADSTETKLDNTIVDLKKSKKDKNEMEGVLDETSSIQQNIIEHKIPMLLRKLSAPVNLPVKFKVRMVEPVAIYRTDPKPVEWPEVVTPCPQRSGLFKRIFNRSLK